MIKLSIYNLSSFSFLLRVIILLGQACSAPKRLEAVPPELEDKANIPGMPDVRYWADEDPSDFLSDGVKALYSDGREVRIGVDVTFAIEPDDDIEKMGLVGHEKWKEFVFAFMARSMRMAQIE